MEHKFRKIKNWFVYDSDGVAFEMTGFRDGVTLNELDEKATYQNGVLAIAEDLIPDSTDVRITGLPETDKVKVGDVLFDIVLDRIIVLD